MIQRSSVIGLALLGLVVPAAAQEARDIVPLVYRPSSPLPLRRLRPAGFRPVLTVLPPSRLASLGPATLDPAPAPAVKAADPPPAAPEPAPAPVVEPVVAPVLGPRSRARFRPVLGVLPPSRIAALGPPDEAVSEPPPPSPPEPPAPVAAATPDPAVATPENRATFEGRRRRGRHPDMIAAAGAHPEIDRLIAAHAKANNIPESMVHRIVVRESRYNPRAVGRGGAMGLMQIKHATARGLGYAGPADGLLDADTNLRYAVPYLAGAYRTANGNPDRTVAYYASGYYYAAKAQAGSRAKPSLLTPADTDGLTQAQRAAAARPSIFSIFAGTAKPADPVVAPVPGGKD